MKRPLFFFGIFFVVIGVFFMAGSAFSLTGYSILSNTSGSGFGLAGILLFFVGISLMRSSVRTAQTSMEFMMTYGWAILASMVSLGVLSYMGIFGGDIGQSTTAILPAPFYASGSVIEALVDSEGGIVGYRIGLEFFKADGKSYTITSINAIDSGTQEILCSYEPVGGLNVGANEKKAVFLDCPSLEAKEFDGKIVISYTDYESMLPQTSSGQLKGKVVSTPYEVQLLVCGTEEAACIEGSDSACEVGGYEGLMACNDECTGYDACVTDQFCGDFVVNGEEECDDFGDPVDCTVEGEGKPGTRICNPDCTYSQCVANE